MGCRMAIKHTIDCELVQGGADISLKTKAILVKSEDLNMDGVPEDEALKKEGECHLTTEDGEVTLVFNRGEMSRILRFMEG